MKKCIRCSTEMIEGLNLMTSNGFATDVREPGAFKGSLGRVECSVCPECGYVELSMKSTERLKEIKSK